MRPKKLLTALAIATVVLIAGCKEDDYVEIEGVCPLVISTSPANGAVSVPPDMIITVTFNGAMNPETITQASFILQSQSAKKSTAADVSGTITYDNATNTASFTPASPLATNTTYSCTVTEAIEDLMGNALQTDYIWTFSTGLTLTPMVISTSPVNNATNVVRNKIITANFSQLMDPSTITATNFTLNSGETSIDGTVSYSGTEASFTPSGILASNTVYTCTVKSSVADMNGNEMQYDYIWSFTTGSTVAPTIISTDPVDLETSVPLNKVISATFSETMDGATITSTSFTLKIGSDLVDGTVNYSGITATFTPTVDLVLGDYTATITTAVKNLGGVPIMDEYQWTFSTNPALGTPFVDLNSVARFGIISGVGVSNNAGVSEIHDMDVGIYPGVRSSITGFPPGIIINGDFYAADDADPVPAMLLQAKNDLVEAYLFAEGATDPAPITVAGDLGGQTLAPGIYKTTSTLLIQSGNLTLDAQGNANAVWIFQIASDFTTVGGSPYPSPAGGNVILAGNAQAKNIFWQVGRSATIGDYTSFKGNILALTSLTMNAYSQTEGRMLCRNGAIELTSTNIINKP